MPLQIIREDITKMRVDAIVNTTNEEMIGYSGVDEAIHLAAGIELDKECERIAPLGLGMVKATKGYNLNCKYIIHTSGPVWEGGLRGEQAILKSCYEESLKLATDLNCESIAFPLISSGTYGYPKDQVLKYAVQIISEYLLNNELTVYLCVFDKTSYEFSKALFADISSFIEEPEPLLMTKCIMSEAIVGSICDDEKSMSIPEMNSASGMSLKEYLRKMDRGFREMLFDLIDESGMTDVECYKRANIDRRTFSKIKGNPHYKPSKQTVIAFAISLKLDLETTQELLSTVGYTLSRANVFDKIIRYFIHNQNYNIYEINEALFEFDQILLGV